jgi:hypothetical protein
VLLRLASGEAEATQFAPELHADISSRMNEASEFYRSLGPLKSFYLIEDKSEGKNQVYHYWAVFGSTRWVQSFVLTAAGKIAELGVEPA